MTKIFIIDDEESVVRLLMEYFNRLNYQCEGYFFDKDLLTSIREFMPDLIICDMNLHTTSGLEVLSDLKQNIDLAGINFIFLTGSINEDAIKKGFELGADECLRKPLDLAEINNQVCFVLDRKRRLTNGCFNILTIDQNEERSEKLSAILLERGNHVLKAKKLSDAKKIIKKNTVDIIISSSNLFDGDILNFYQTAGCDLHNKYFVLMVDANETALISKARNIGINDFIYTNYGDNYFRGKLYQVLHESSAFRFRVVFSLKDANPEKILNNCKAKAFTGEISVVSENGSGTISMNNGELTNVKFNDQDESNALAAITSLKEGEMIIKQTKFDFN